MTILNQFCINLGWHYLQVAEPLLPYALAFAAGAMVYVVADDIIPEANSWYAPIKKMIHPTVLTTTFVNIYLGWARVSPTLASWMVDLLVYLAYVFVCLLRLQFNTTMHHIYEP